MQLEGQLSGHSHTGVTVKSSRMIRRDSSQFLNLNVVRANETAEGALTFWSRRKISRKVRSQVSNKLEVQQEGQLSGHLRSGVVENLAKKRGISVRTSFKRDKKDS